MILCPHNPILWTDLAYFHTISGHKYKADRCIRIALSLNNYNPHILRSAARYYIFNEDPEMALEIIRSAPNLLANPLLLSSEISIAEAYNIKTTNVKKGVSILQSNDFPKHLISELNASIATLECNTGNLKKGKKLIANALLEPNENTLAQIQYLSEKNALPFMPQVFDVPCRFEADALNYFYSNKYEEAISESRKWFDFHPFSSRPAILNSYINATMFNNYDEAIEIIDETLSLSPANSLLLNNKAFSLAKLGKTEQAVACIKEIQKFGIKEFDEIDNHTMKATLGLIAYRSGDPETGRKLYKEAVDYFDSRRLFFLQARALYFWSQEEKECNTNEAKKIFLKVSDMAKRYDIQEIKFLTEKYQES